MKSLTITLLTLLMSLGAWSEEIGLECKSDDRLLVNWYRLDLDKGTVRYNTSTQNYLNTLKNLIGTELSGDVHNLMWREKELNESFLQSKIFNWLIKKLEAVYEWQSSYT